MADDLAEDHTEGITAAAVASQSQQRPASLLEQASQNIIISESPAMKTPHHISGTPFQSRTAQGQRPMRRLTRSMMKNGDFGMLESGLESTFQARINAISRRGGPAKLAVALEQAESIHYSQGNAAQGDADDHEKEPRVRSLIASRSRNVRSTKRKIAAPWSSSGAERDATPESTVLTKVSRARVQKRITATNGVVSRPPRRSARLAKPLTEFHLFAQLPQELQIMVWEAAITPRVVYIRNRSGQVASLPLFMPHIQNQQPRWVMACRTSWWVALRNYKTMFGLMPGTLPSFDPNYSTRQAFNINTDIALLEPCCPGCRAYSCTRHQYLAEDRGLVRFLAVQVESPLLMASAMPCWATISSSFPNVETIYMTRTSITGEALKDKALIRCSENEHEKGLLRRFTLWKKTDGKNSKVQSIEFVHAVDREYGKLTDLYKDVHERKLGAAEDIVIG